MTKLHAHPCPPDLRIVTRLTIDELIVISTYEALRKVFRSCAMFEPLPDDSKDKIAQLLTLGMAWVHDGNDINQVASTIADVFASEGSVQ